MAMAKKYYFYIVSFVRKRQNGFFERSLLHLHHECCYHIQFNTSQSLQVNETNQLSDENIWMKRNEKKSGILLDTFLGVTENDNFHFFPSLSFLWFAWKTLTKKRTSKREQWSEKKAKMIVAQRYHWWEPATERTSEIEWDLNLYSPVSSRLCAWFVSFRSPFEYKISVEKIISGHSIYWMGIACYCSEMNILLASCSRFWFQFSVLFLSLDKLWRTSFYIHRE